MTRYKITFIKLITPILLFTSIASAELSEECKECIFTFIQVESLKDKALTVIASKETISVCVNTLKNAEDKDVAIIEQIMDIGMSAEKEIIL